MSGATAADVPVGRIESGEACRKTPAAYGIFRSGPVFLPNSIFSPGVSVVKTPRRSAAHSDPSASLSRGVELAGSCHRGLQSDRGPALDQNATTGTRSGDASIPRRQELVQRVETVHRGEGSVGLGAQSGNDPGECV